MLLTRILDTPVERAIPLIVLDHYDGSVRLVMNIDTEVYHRA